MEGKIFTRIFFVLMLLGSVLQTDNLFAQKWSGVHGNEWLAGKYGQSWIRIGVNTKGIHRVAISSLPANFQNADKSKLQLWHRGNQVSILKADNTEILFYGVPNDGASDSLLYRLSSSRVNPYFSIYSLESAYFLTIGTNNGLRAASENLTVDNSVAPLQFHIKTDVKTYQNEYTHTTLYSSRPATMNSYFEEGKTATGSRIPILTDLSKIHTSNPKSITYTNTYVPEPFSFQVKSLYNNSLPTVKVLLSGRFGNAQAEIHVGKTDATLRQAAIVPTSGFFPKEYSFSLTNQDFDANGNGTLGFRSSVAQNYFSVTYFTLTYNQLIDMQNLNSYEFNFPATSDSKSRLAVSNPASGSAFYDISKPDQPRIILGDASNLMVSRGNTPLKLLATSIVNDVVTEKISSVTFQQANPVSYDYLIISNETLASSANSYANYRQNLTPGKKYKPLVKNIRDIYNEFNYGEPSPVAIRRFVDYMISDGNKDKYLFLFGKSITRQDRIVKELPDEVPTVGFPGSDLLLTDGLGGVPEDVPAIPVGRIAAISNQQVLDYLAKITTYESQSSVAWRKNVMHISGGKDQNEINQFATYLSNIGTSVSGTGFAGKVYTKVKSIPQDVQEQITIAPELNGTHPTIKGLGMVSYFGHGSTYRTDLNAGYVSDPAKGYDNNGLYPVLFYNGCGVGNIFSNLFDQTVNLSTSRPMSLDWLLAPSKGAIVVFGNDWDAYASTSNEYLDRLYPLIFSKSDAQRQTIGQILQDVAAQTKEAKGYTYNTDQNARVTAYYDADRANIHQVLLQGDPALRILITENPLPVNLISFEAKMNGSKMDLVWKTVNEVSNSHFDVERSYNAKNFEVIGSVEGKGDTNQESTYSYTDSKPLDGTSYYRLKQVDRDKIVEGKVITGDIEYSRIISVTKANSSLLVFSPNPTTDFVEIKLNAPVKIKSWNLIDVTGRTIQKEQTGNTVNLSNLSAGEYLIEITTSNGDKYSKKIVKQ